MADLIEPIHPGEILLEDFIGGFEIAQNDELRLEGRALHDTVAQITQLQVA